MFNNTKELAQYLENLSWESTHNWYIREEWEIQTKKESKKIEKELSLIK